MNREDYLSKQEFAARLKISRRTMERWIENQVLPEPTWFGARRYWSKNTVESVLQHGTGRLQAA